MAERPEQGEESCCRRPLGQTPCDLLGRAQQRGSGGTEGQWKGEAPTCLQFEHLALCRSWDPPLACVPPRCSDLWPKSLLLWPPFQITVRRPRGVLFSYHWRILATSWRDILNNYGQIESPSYPGDSILEIPVEEILFQESEDLIK